MKKSIWIFLLAVLVPGFVLGWLALRSAEEQQIIFERRTAELYQKETETLAGTVREAVEGERRAFGDTVHRLLANGDAEALARDFSNTLADAWPRKAIGFALDRDGKMLSPTVASAALNPDWRGFLVANGSFLSGSEPAVVYAVPVDGKPSGYAFNPRSKSLAIVSNARTDDERSSVEAGAVHPAPGDVMPQNRGGDRELQESLRKAGELFDTAGATGGARGSADRLREATADKPSWDADANKPAVELQGAVALKTQTAARSGLAAPKPNAAPAAASAPAPIATTPREMSDSNPAAIRPVATAEQAKKEAGDQTRLIKRRGSVTELESGQRKQPEPLDLGEPQPVAQPFFSDPASQVAILKDNEAIAQRQVAVQSKGDAYANFTQNRLVEPQQLLGAPSNALSALVPSTAEFRSLTEGSDEGMISRFVQDKLDLIFWIRPPEAPEMVFGCLFEAANLAELWNAALEKQGSVSRGSYEGSDAKPQYVTALLDDRGRPAAVRPVSATVQEWKRPFVASEIGEMLPHWEAALYLASPTALAEGARGLRRTLTFTIVGAVALIALGGWLVVADARRQLALAQQKTDFVSNVSHELKTPLTSIRMFAELMHDRPPPPEKQGQYLRIITVEAERLTRLINNVLDFAKIGRKQKRFEKKPLDLHGVISRVWESQGLHLREAGFQTRWEAAPGPYPVLGDEDAIAQVLVNLLSNAEKYSQDRKEVELHTWIEGGWLNVTVVDRGMGVPKGEERKIFDAFYRAHDSLSSGIQGSGLGLTLAQRVAREHGGEIRFERRDGGGSRFTLRLPIDGKSGAEPIENSLLK